MSAYNQFFASYGEFCQLRLWCLKHNPDLLGLFHDPFMSYSEWKTLSNPHNYGGKVAIAGFLEKEDHYLYWHCPWDFVRKYLEDNCGYKKANWFVKLFWKH